MMARISLISFAVQGADGLSILFDTTAALFQAPGEDGLRVLQQTRTDPPFDSSWCCRS